MFSLGPNMLMACVTRDEHPSPCSYWQLAGDVVNQLGHVGIRVVSFVTLGRILLHELGHIRILGINDLGLVCGLVGARLVLGMIVADELGNRKDLANTLNPTL